MKINVNTGRNAALLAAAGLLLMACGAKPPETTALPGDRAYPENITSTADGTLYVGNFAEGGVVRIKPGAKPEAWIAPAAYGTRSVLGLLADEASSTLWLCSNDLSALGVAGPSDIKGAMLKGFDLRTGEGKVSAAFPGEVGLCNDLALDASGGVYVTNTMAPEILKLSADRKTLEVWKTDPLLAPPASGGGGLDGIAFGADGHLYVNTFGGGELFRVQVEQGVAGSVTRLKTSRPLTLPDALRAYGKDGFLMIEGNGTLDRVRIDGDTATIDTIRQGLNGPTGVTQVGDVAWVTEGKLSYLLDPALKQQAVPLPFQVHRIALPSK